MSHQALAMSETASSAAQTELANLDAAITAVHAKQVEFARLPVRAKIGLLGDLIPATLANVDEWIREACRAKGLTENTPLAGEEWLGGPLLLMRNLRLLVETMEQIERDGAPPLGRKVHQRPDGRIAIDVFPGSAFDSLLYSGFSAQILLQEGMTEEEARAKQASFYKQKNPTGGTTLVLGAGNVASIPPMDALYKLFVEGRVCIIKMNPVNEYLGPVFEKVFAPLIARNYVRIVYGGAEVGAYLCQHPLIDDIHITGSDRTHDAIVWGPQGPDRERRKAANDPLLKKTITSELGNVSPVMLVPGTFTDAQLDFQARNVASQMTNNASFNCNAAKMLITAKGWPQRDAFLARLKAALAKAHTRKAYYPGAFERYATLTKGRTQVEKIGAPSEGQLPWTIIGGLDPSNLDEPLYQTEPFCSIISHVELPVTDAAAFLQAATTFANDRLWGTLNACIIIHPTEEKRPAVASALDKAIIDLRYGTVAINHWPALGYGFVTTPWGGHPSATLNNIQSGLGWVHNTYMIEGIEKGVIRGPFTVFPKPPWFFDHARTHEVASKLTRFEAHPSWFALPSVVLSAARG
jgi:acyl-CoA reductase-like NAD-dependent aldehyde dehydrogenase